MIVKLDKDEIAEIICALKNQLYTVLNDENLKTLSGGRSIFQLSAEESINKLLDKMYEYYPELKQDDIPF